MATVDQASTIITALNAHTSLPIGGINGGPLVEFIASIEVPIGDAGSKYALFRLPWNFRISDLEYCCDAIAGLTVDIGWYQTQDNGGAVGDADEFASAVACTSALAVWTDVLGEAAVSSEKLCDRAEKPFWKVIGLTTEPVGTMYDIVATSVGAATASATLAVRLRGVHSN